MSGDPGKVIVTEQTCVACGVDNVTVYHENLPELRIAAETAAAAADQLAVRLASSLDVVVDPARREPVVQAIADTKAFVEQQGGHDTGEGAESLSLPTLTVG